MDGYYYLSNLAMVLCVTILLAGLTCPLKGNVLKYSLFIVLYYALGIFLWNFLKLPDAYSFIIDKLFIFAFLLCIFRKKLSSTLIISSLCLIIGISLELLEICVYKLILTPNTKELFHSYKDQSIFYSVLGVVLFLVYLFIPLRKLVNYIENNFKRNYLLLINIIIYFCMAKIIFESNALGKDKYIFSLKTVFIFLLTLAFIILNIIIFKSILEEKNQKRMIEQYKSFEETVHTIVEEIRTKQHDFKNHLTTIKCLSSNNEGNSSTMLDSYINDINSDLKEFEPFIKIKNKVVGAILHTKCIEAEKHNINIEISIPAYDIELPLLDFEYAAIVFNLLDNAIEATEKYKSNDRKMVFKLDYEQNSPFIEVWNTGEPIQYEIIPKLFKKGYSTKEGNGKHGYGLYNVKKIVNKYNGKLEVINKSPFVIFRVGF